MKARLLTMLVVIAGIFIIAGCAFAVRYDGPYEGRIIDADTGQPIEGVVILGVWNTETPTPAGAHTKFYDAREMVTDKNGDFKIQGLGLLVMSNVIPMDVLIFKAGYEYIGLGPWVGLKTRGWKGEYKETYDPVRNAKVSKRLYDQKEKVRWEGNKAIIPLKKLTREERLKQLGPPSPPDEAPKTRIMQMLTEINKDRSERGLGSIKVGR